MTKRNPTGVVDLSIISELNACRYGRRVKAGDKLSLELYSSTVETA